MCQWIALFLTLATVSLRGADLHDVQQLMAQKRVPEAAEILIKLKQEQPEKAEVLGLLGSCQLMMLETESALANLERASELAPNDDKILAMLGSAYIGEAGRKSSLTYARKGKSTLEKALKQNPENIIALEILIGFYSEAPWIAGGNKERAKELITKMNAVNPPRGFAIKVGILAKAKKFTEAFQLCDEFNTLFPDNYVGLYELGRICGMASKRQEEGIKALEQCLTLPVPEAAPGHEGVNFRLGVLHKQLAHPELAETHFELALKQAGENSPLAKMVERARKS